MTTLKVEVPGDRLAAADAVGMTLRYCGGGPSALRNPVLAFLAELEKALRGDGPAAVRSALSAEEVHVLRTVLKVAVGRCGDEGHRGAAGMQYLLREVEGQLHWKAPAAPAVRPLRAA